MDSVLLCFPPVVVQPGERAKVAAVVDRTMALRCFRFAHNVDGLMFEAFELRSAPCDVPGFIRGRVQVETFATAFANDSVSPIAFSHRFQYGEQVELHVRNFGGVPRTLHAVAVAEDPRLSPLRIDIPAFQLEPAGGEFGIVVPFVEPWRVLSVFFAGAHELAVKSIVAGTEEMIMAGLIPAAMLASTRVHLPIFNEKTKLKILVKSRAFEQREFSGFLLGENLNRPALNLCDELDHAAHELGLDDDEDEDTEP